MTSKGIEIPLVVDTAKALGPVEKVGDAFDQVADSLDDVAKVSGQAETKVTADMRDVAQAGDKAADKVDTSFKSAFDEVRTRSKKAGDDLGDNVKRGAKDADEGVSALKENTASNAKEMGASFQDVGSALDALQGLSAEALEGFGPAGIAAGVAVAAGIGLATQALQAAADKANKLTEDATALADTMSDPDLAQRATDLRDRFDEVAKAVSDVRSIWEVWQPRAITNAEDFASAVKAGAVSADDLMSAFTETDPIKRVQALKDVSAELAEGLKKATYEAQRSDLVQKQAGESDIARSQRLGRVQEAIERASKAIADETATQEASLEITKALAIAKGQTVEAYQAEQAAAEAHAATVDAETAAIKSAADPVSVYNNLLAKKQDAEKTAAEATAAATEDSKDSWEDYAQAVTVTVDDLIQTFLDQAAQAQQFETNLATIAANGGQALADELRAKGPEVAAAAAATIAESGPQKMAQVIAAYSAATGAKMGADMAAQLAGQTPAVQAAMTSVIQGVKPPSILLSVDMTDAERQLFEFMNRKNVVSVDIKTVVRPGQAVAW